VNALYTCSLLEVRHFAVKPRIDRTNLKTTTVRVGRRVFLDVDVMGEPCPEVSWFDAKGNEITTDTDHFTIDNVPYNTKFTIEDGMRKHSMKYKIVAKNEHGEDFEWVEIVFLGPPSKPMGKRILTKILFATRILHSRSLSSERHHILHLQAQVGATRG